MLVGLQSLLGLSEYLVVFIIDFFPSFLHFLDVIDGSYLLRFVVMILEIMQTMRAVEVLSLEIRAIFFDALILDWGSSARALLRLV